MSETQTNPQGLPCPVCGHNFVWERTSESGALTICFWCLTKNTKKGVIRREPADDTAAASNKPGGDPSQR